MSFLAKSAKKSRGKHRCREHTYTLELNFSNGMLLIKVDGIDYAQIDHVSSMADVDLKEIKDWVEYTYPIRDYKSIMYTPGRLLFSDFAKNRKK